MSAHHAGAVAVPDDGTRRVIPGAGRTSPVTGIGGSLGEGRPVRPANRGARRVYAATSAAYGLPRQAHQAAVGSQPGQQLRMARAARHGVDDRLRATGAEQPPPSVGAPDRGGAGPDDVGIVRFTDCGSERVGPHGSRPNRSADPPQPASGDRVPRPSIAAVSKPGSGRRVRTASAGTSPAASDSGTTTAAIGRAAA